MAAEHPHTESTLHWGWGRIVRHLSDDHDVQIPMSWTVGQAHDAHLKAHVGGDSLAQPEKECEAFYGVGDGTSATCRRPVNHPPVSEDGIGHSPQPIPIHAEPKESSVRVCGAVNPEHPNLICTYAPDHGPIKDPVDTTWNSFDGVFDHGNPERSLWWVLPVDTEKPELDVQAASQAATDVRVLRDRFIAVMAGLDFDHQWAADTGIGAAARGLLREQHGAGVDRLMRWLLHGGAMFLEPVASLAEDLEKERALVCDMEEANNTLREQLAMTGRQLAETKARLDMTQTASTNLQQQLRALTEERDRLDQQLTQVTTGNQRNVGSIDALEERLAEAREERAQALEAVMAAQAKAVTLREERDAAKEKQRLLVADKDALTGELEARIRALTSLQRNFYRVRRERDEALADRQEALTSQAEFQQALERALGTPEWEPELHPYADSYSGMVCGALVLDEEGHGRECGLPAGHRVHDAPEPAEPATDPQAEAHHDLMSWARRFAEGG
jgi:hypothetical protein